MKNGSRGVPGTVTKPKIVNSEYSLEIQMLKAVFLDLDNTLILFDELKYYTAYFKKLNSFFQDEFTLDELRERVVNMSTKPPPASTCVSIFQNPPCRKKSKNACC